MDLRVNLDNCSLKIENETKGDQANRYMCGLVRLVDGRHTSTHKAVGENCKRILLLENTFQTDLTQSVFYQSVTSQFIKNG